MRGYLVITNGDNHVEFRDSLKVYCFHTDCNGYFDGVDLYATNSEGKYDIAGICDSLAKVEHDSYMVRAGEQIGRCKLGACIDPNGRKCEVDVLGNIYYSFPVKVI